MKIRREIPITQAAYPGDRSTTEHVHTCKLLAEKAITSQNYETTILLLDMSKAFDTVRRNDLLQQLKEVLDEDEVHIIKILLKDVKLVVKMGRHMGEEILTNIGVPQGDCCSPILFTLYLANALRQESVHQDHIIIFKTVHSSRRSFTQRVERSCILHPQRTPKRTPQRRLSAY